MNYADIFGYLAAIGTSFSFVPQVYKIIKTRNTEGISLLMYAVYVVAVFFWLLYGIMVHSWPVAAANALTLLLSGTVLVLKLLDKKKY